jgi:GNAT superfamily N-acetyltransferase
MNLVIRKATSGDMPAIHALVVDLAIYEREPNAVKTSVSDFEHAFYQGIFDTFVATIDDRVIGMCLYYMTFSTWRGKCVYLEDFYVLPEFRRTGIGQQLFDRFIDESKKLGATMVKWQIIDFNDPALAFYRKNHATIETNWWNGKLFFDKNGLD